MKIYSREFERRLRRTVRAGIRASPELKREAKRVKRQRHHKLNKWIIFSLVYFALLIGSGVSMGLRVQLLVVTLLSVLTVAVMVIDFFDVVFRSADLNTFFHLPLSDREVFHRQLRLFLKKTIGP